MRSCGPEYVLSGVDEYKRLAAMTGGQFIEIDKFDVDEVVGMLEEGVQESEVRTDGETQIKKKNERWRERDFSLRDQATILSLASC